MDYFKKIFKSKKRKENTLINSKDYILKYNLELLNEENNEENKRKNKEINKNINPNYEKIKISVGNAICSYSVNFFAYFDDDKLKDFRYSGNTSKNIKMFFDIFYDKVIKKENFSNDVFIIIDSNLLLIEELGIVKNYKKMDNKRKNEFAIAITSILNSCIEYLSLYKEKNFEEIDPSDLL